MDILSPKIGHKVVFLESLHPTTMVEIEIDCKNPKIFRAFYDPLFCDFFKNCGFTNVNRQTKKNVVSLYVFEVVGWSHTKIPKIPVPDGSNFWFLPLTSHFSFRYVYVKSLDKA